MEIAILQGLLLGRSSGSSMYVGSMGGRNPNPEPQARSGWISERFRGLSRRPSFLLHVVFYGQVRSSFMVVALVLFVKKKVDRS